MYTGVLCKTPRPDVLQTTRGYHSYQRFSLLPHQRYILNSVLAANLQTLSGVKPPVEVSIVELLAESGLYVVVRPSSRMLGTRRFVVPVDALKSEFEDVEAELPVGFSDYRLRSKPRSLVVIGDKGSHGSQSTNFVEDFLLSKWVASQMSMHGIVLPARACAVGYCPDDEKKLFYLVKFENDLLLPLPIDVLAEPKTSLLKDID